MYETPTDIIKHINEINEHIATDGNADDYSSEIRKNVKKRAVALKKLAAEAKKYAQKKEREASLTRGNIRMKLKSRRRSRAVENKCGREYDPILKESE